MERKQYTKPYYSPAERAAYKQKKQQESFARFQQCQRDIESCQQVVGECDRQIDIIQKEEFALYQQRLRERTDGLHKRKKHFESQLRSIRSQLQEKCAHCYVDYVTKPITPKFPGAPDKITEEIHLHACRYCGLKIVYGH
jgi:hypothetical protein